MTSIDDNTNEKNEFVKQENKEIEPKENDADDEDWAKVHIFGYLIFLFFSFFFFF